MKIKKYENRKLFIVIAVITFVVAIPISYAYLGDNTNDIYKIRIASDDAIVTSVSSSGAVTYNRMINSGTNTK